MDLLKRESIAGAVAREIDLICQGWRGAREGVGYKFAWNRRGSPYLNHVAVSHGDMCRFKRSPSMVRLTVKIEGARV